MKCGSWRMGIFVRGQPLVLLVLLVLFVVVVVNAVQFIFRAFLFGWIYGYTHELLLLLLQNCGKLIGNWMCEDRSLLVYTVHSMLAFIRSLSCFYSHLLPPPPSSSGFICFRFIFILCLQAKHTTKRKYKCQQIVECVSELWPSVQRVFVLYIANVCTLAAIAIYMHEFRWKTVCVAEH